MNELETIAEIERLQRQDIRANCQYRGERTYVKLYLCTAERKLNTFCKNAISVGDEVYCGFFMGREQ